MSDFACLEPHYQEISDTAHSLNMDPPDLAVSIYFESAGTCDPQICNIYLPPEGSSPAQQYKKRWDDCAQHERDHVVAIGLIQFTVVGLSNINLTFSQLATMTVKQQLEVVRRYLAHFKGHLQSIDQVYLSILYPVAVDKEDTFVMFRGPSGLAYRQNHGLDTNHDGVVTRGEVVARIRALRASFKPCWVTGTCTV